MVVMSFKIKKYNADKNEISDILHQERRASHKEQSGGGPKGPTKQKDLSLEQQSVLACTGYHLSKKSISLYTL